MLNKCKGVTLRVSQCTGCRVAGATHRPDVAEGSREAAQDPLGTGCEDGHLHHKGALEVGLEETLCKH